MLRPTSVSDVADFSLISEIHTNSCLFYSLNANSSTLELELAIASEARGKKARTTV